MSRWGKDLLVHAIKRKPGGFTYLKKKKDIFTTEIL